MSRSRLRSRPLPSEPSWRSLTGPFVLRLRDLPLLMVTLALGAIAFEAANKATWLTGGDDGLVGIEFKPVLGIFEWTLSSDTAYFYALGWLCICLYLARRVVNSPFGLAVVGVRENFRRMALLGAPVQKHLLRIYVIGGAMAALAGALSVETARFVGLVGAERRDLDRRAGDAGGRRRRAALRRADRHRRLHAGPPRRRAD